MWRKKLNKVKSGNGKSGDSIEKSTKGESIESTAESPIDKPADLSIGKPRDSIEKSTKKESTSLTKVSVEDIERSLSISLTANQKYYFENKQMNKYVAPLSNQQFSVLLTKFNKPYVYFRLCQLICKFGSSSNFAKYTYQLLSNRYATDTALLENIFKDMPAITSVREYSKEYVAEYYVTIIRNLKLKPTSLLDIGCGNCILTKDLGLALGISKQNIVGADVPNEFEKKWEAARPADIKFVTIVNNKLKFDRQFDMISCMMVLHHVDLNIIPQYIIDIYNLLTPGGIFLLKEHDCFNAMDYIIADLEHSLYIAKEAFALQSDRKLTPDTIRTIKAQQMYYFDRFTWRIWIERVGFRCIYEVPYDNGLSNTYGPNRAYVAIFQK